MSVSLPMGMAAITPVWLTEALSVRYPGTEVFSVESGRAVNGMATKVHVEIAYNAEGLRHGLPGQAWFKGGLDELHPWHVASYISEARFFQDWSSGMRVNLPKVFWCGIEEARQGLVLMEDLDQRNARYGHATAPLSFVDARSAVAQLALLHARYWNDPVLARLGSYTDRFASPDYPLPRFLEPEHYRRCMDSGRGDTAPPLLRSAEGMWKALRALWAITDEGVQCFCHGDGHIGNFFFVGEGEAGLLDWQAYLRSQPLFDVAYFLCGALNTTDRRRYERELIASYLQALGEAGVSGVPGFDDAWLAYRRFALHGFIWAGVMDGARYEDAVPSTYASRYGAACVDLDTLTALGL